ncbi:hypothetical protein ACTD5D_21155 [Nocardia takedensis]|uniref:hypothetical protein n=1 Tax=Nocardia takedensis TaxID=259390 RepID=UPI003F768D70
MSVVVGPESSSLRSALTVGGALVSQAAVLVPVLYYFGAVYARARYGYFGIDSALLGFTVTDYLRQSLNPLFWPVVLAMVALLVLIAVRGIPAALAARTRHECRYLRIWHAVTIVAGAGMLAVSPVIRIGGVPPWFPHNNYLLPGSLIIGSVLLGYATTLHSSRPDLWRARPAQVPLVPRRQPHADRPTMVVIMIALFTLGLAGAFWTVGQYASEQGHNDARGLVDSKFRGLPSVVVYSVEGLAVTGTGVDTRELDVPGEKYRFYSGGLRLLHQTPEAYFLIPQQWTPGKERVLILPRGEDIRIDLDATHGQN